MVSKPKSETASDIPIMHYICKSTVLVNHNFATAQQHKPATDVRQKSITETLKTDKNKKTEPIFKCNEVEIHQNKTKVFSRTNHLMGKHTHFYLFAITALYTADYETNCKVTDN